MTLLIAVHFAVAVVAPWLLRGLRGRAFIVLALVPAATFVWTLAQSATVLAGGVVSESLAWIPALGIDVSFRIGLLQWVLALIVSGVGALVLFYCRFYFDDADPPVRTGAVLVAFAGAMVALVTSDDLIGLYVFWELTTVFSYLLVGHNPAFTANRRAALTALIVTTFGGLAMLTGIVLLAVRYDTFSLSGVLAGAQVSGVGTAVVTTAVVLLLVGALTKSALVPFHFWLPGAMAAPTPVSAYLHAAAMVKAGVYLVAVLAPVFATSPGWRPITLALGATTMIIGGWRALRQYDIKVLLAYGTVSQLGFLIVLCGMGTRAAALGGLALVISHALFKSTLFLIVGIVDHSAGTRDLRKLSGVGRSMPVVAIAAVVAGASMAALPPTIGFTAKEGAFEALTYLVADGDGTRVPGLPAVLLAVALVAGSALTVAYTLRFLWGAFARKDPRQFYLDPSGSDERVSPCHDVSPGFALAPVLLASLCLVGGFVGHPLTEVLNGYVAAFTVGEESHGIALWHGFSVPLLMSVLALLGGIVLFWQRSFIARAQSTFPEAVAAEEVYQRIMRGLDRLAVEVTAVTQRGSLPLYLGSILVVVVVLPGGALLTVRSWPTLRAFDSPAQLLVGAVMVVAAVVAATSRGRLRAVMLVGVTGYGVAMLFLLQGAPDLALTQVLVETVTLVVFALVLRKLPKYFTTRPLHSSRWWRLIVAGLAGAVVVMVAVVAGGARTATPVSEAFYEAAYTFGYGRNIVNITLVDIRAWDTMGEIAVLVVAATGVASLIFIRSRYSVLPRRPTAADQPPLTGEPVPAGRTTWLRGGETLSPVRRSIIFEVVTRVLFPVMIVVSVYLLIAGHNGPGGGFAGGLVAGMALVIRYLAAGSKELDEAAPVDAGKVLGSGLALAALSALAPVAFGGKILQSYDITFDFGPLVELATPLGTLPLLGSPHLVTSVFFDVGVYLVVIGVMLDLARSLGSGIDQHELEDRAPAPGGNLEAAR